MKTIVLLLKGEASLPSGLNGLKPAGGSVMW